MFAQGPDGIPAVARQGHRLRDRDQVGDDIVKRPARVELVRASRPEQWLDPLQVVEDQRSLRRSLAVVVARPTSDPIEDHPGRRAEQHDRVEAVIELRLVSYATLDEQAGAVIEVEQLSYPVLDPQPLASASLFRGPDPFGPAGIIGVYHPIAASSQFGERRGLSRAGHPGDEHTGGHLLKS